VPTVFDIEGTVLLIALLASVLVKIFAFVSSLMYSREADRKSVV